MLTIRSGWIIAICAVCGNANAATITSFNSKPAFDGAVSPDSIASFDDVAPGFGPPQLSFGGVTVELTQAGSAPIFPAEVGGIAFGDAFGFGTQFLSVAVKNGENNVVITLPGNLGGAGFFIGLNGQTFSITATDGEGDFSTSLVVLPGDFSVGFFGFDSTAGIRELRISSPAGGNLRPIVNIGNIAFGAMRPSEAPEPATATLFAVSLGALLFARRFRSGGDGPSRKREPSVDSDLSSSHEGRRLV